MAAQHTLIIDDRRSNDFSSVSGNQWRLITDGVMGGVSEGQLTVDNIDGRYCLRIQGDVRLDNNGGFVQAAVDLARKNIDNIADYTGLMLEAYGNDQQYNIHLRSDDIWLPWQSYRASFTAVPEWQTIYLPFADFTPYRIRKALNITKLKRIGLVAIGREFSADLCISKVALYR